MTKQVEPTVVRTLEEAARAYVGEERLALDLETGGFSPWRDPIHVISLYGEKSNTITVLHYPKGEKVPWEVLEWLSTFPELVTHNGVQFDLLFLAVAGMEWDRPRIYDTMIGEQSVQVADRRDIRVNLKDTVKRRFGKVLDKEINHGGWGNPELDADQMEYVTGDIRYLVALREKQLARADEIGVRTSTELEMRVAVPVVRMGLNGLPVDLEALEHYFDGRVDRHREVCAYLQERLGPINVGSQPQLMVALGGLYPGLFPSTGAEVLLDRKRAGGEIGELCQAILDWRNYRQRASMFGPQWRETYVIDHGGHYRIHGRFWQIGTNTGRFSSAEPSLQQVPRDMRGVFGNVPGWAVGKSDYAAIEVRVAAALANDRDMIEAFNAGEDIHTLVASVAFGKPQKEVTKEERQQGKALSFTLLFGGGPSTYRAYAASHGSSVSHEEAVTAVEGFFARFHGLRRMREVAEGQAANLRQVTLTYPTGLKRQVRGASMKSTVLLNNSVQGVAGAGLKFALLEMEEAGVSRHLSAVIHDETVYCAPEGEIEEVRREIDGCMGRGMRRALEGCSPISIGVESRWGTTWVGDPETEVVTEWAAESNNCSATGLAR